jgi:hypothetical protein
MSDDDALVNVLWAESNSQRQEEDERRTPTRDFDDQPDKEIEMAHPLTAAQRILYAVAPDGSGQDLVIGIEAPYEDDGCWRAKLSLGALESQVFAIAGVDSWQAVYLAMRFAAMRLDHFAGNGWTFYWEKHGAQTLPDDLLR